MSTGEQVVDAETDADIDAETGLPVALRRWIEDATGAHAVTAKQVPGGASRQAWLIDVEGGAEGELFLRYDPRPPKPDSAFHTLQVEAEVVDALHRAGARVPRVVAAHPTRQAVLMSRVPGATWFYLISDRDEQVRVAQDFIARLAEIHRIDPAGLGIASFGPPRSAREHIAEQLDAIRRRMARAKGDPSPLLRFCVDWLERNMPDYDGPVVLVQGDTGPGNFMYADGAVTAVVDWELAHFGDPMDDIAWLSLRSAQEPFTHFPDRLAEYERLSGHPVDHHRVWYYRLLAETKLATFHGGTGVDRRGPVAVGSPDAGNNMIYAQFHRRMLIEALGHAAGIDTTPLEFADDLGTESSEQHVYDATLEVLRAVTGQTSDALAVRWTKGAARLVRYLRECDRSGPRVDADELDEMAALLGRRPATIEAGRTELSVATTAGKVSDLDYITQMWRCVQRDDYLMRTASGALHRRTWPPLAEPETVPR